MTSMGMKRRDMHGPAEVTEKPEKDYDNEVCYPCLSATGRQAEMLGAESLDDGEYVQQTVVWRVKKTTIEREGKKNYELSLELVKASNPEAVDEPEGTESDDDDESDEKPSAGLDFILSGKNR